MPAFIVPQAPAGMVELNAPPRTFGVVADTAVVVAAVRAAHSLSRAILFWAALGSDTLDIVPLCLRLCHYAICTAVVSKSRRCRDSMFDTTDQERPNLRSHPQCDWPIQFPGWNLLSAAPPVILPTCPIEKSYCPSRTGKQIKSKRLPGKEKGKFERRRSLANGSNPWIRSFRGLADRGQYDGVTSQS